MSACERFTYHLQEDRAMKKRTMTRKELTRLAAELREYYLLWEKLRHAISTLPRTRPQSQRVRGGPACVSACLAAAEEPPVGGGSADCFLIDLAIRISFSGLLALLAEPCGSVRYCITRASIGAPNSQSVGRSPSTGSSDAVSSPGGRHR